MSRLNTYAIRTVVALYALIVVVMIILSAVTYKIQWPLQVNRERQRYLEVIEQSIRYYYFDHERVLPPLPEGTHLISNADSCSYACPRLGRDLSCVNLDALLVPSYVRRVPQDPLLLDAHNSGFFFTRTGSAITLGACYTFFSQDVTLQRDFGGSVADTF